MKELELLRKLLQEKGCEEEFFEYTRSYNLEGFMPNEWVDSCFVWISSPQGQQFWSELDCEWKEILEALEE